MARGRRSEIARAFRLHPGDAADIEVLLRQPRLQAGYARRLRIVVAVAAGDSLATVALRLGISRRHLYKWLARYTAQGLDGLKDKPGRGRWLRTPKTAAPSARGA